MPALHFQVTGLAPENRTETVRFETALGAATRLVMDEPGGAIDRPAQKRYTPTFWPFQTFFRAAGTRRGAIFFRGLPGAASFQAGRVDLITHRNALQETAWGGVHFLGNPVKGHERTRTILDYGIRFTGPEDWPAIALMAEARRVLELGSTEPSDKARLAEAANWLVAVDPPEVQVLAIKSAGRGSGLIIRLYAPGYAGKTISLQPTLACQDWLAGHRPQPEIRQAWLCDARERDLLQLPIDNAGVIRLEMPGSIASLRLR